MKVVIVGDIRRGQLGLDQVSFPLGCTTNTEHGSCETCTDVRCQNVVVVVSFQLCSLYSGWHGPFAGSFCYKAAAELSSMIIVVLLDSSHLSSNWLLDFDV